MKRIIEHIIQKKIHGGALFYALLMAVIIATFSTMLISTAYFQRLTYQQQALENNLLHNAKAGFQLLLHQPKNFEGLLYAEHAEDSIQLISENWGLFQLVYSLAFQTTSQGKKEKRLSALIGITPNQEVPALYLQDNYKPLALCGSSHIIGDALLPRSGLRAGNLPGQPLTTTVMVSGKTSISSQALLPLDTILLQMLLYQWKDLNSLGLTNAIPDSLIAPFSDSLISIRQKSIVLSNTFIQGKVAFVADTIRVKASAQIEDALLFAPYIFIEQGFSGQLQAIASQRLEVAPGAALSYPSGLVLIDGPGRLHNYTPELIMRQQSTLHGYILQTQLQTGRIAEATIEDGCKVQGQLNIMGNIALSGLIEGQLCCSGFSLRYRGRNYYNYLLNAVISQHAIPEYFVNSSVFQPNADKKWEVVKWLN